MSDISIERLWTGYRLATMHKGYRVCMRYFGYTKAECVRMFRAHLKTL